MWVRHISTTGLALLLVGCMTDATPLASNDGTANAPSKVELIQSGRTIAETRCARCHAIGTTGTSPYPGAQPFRNLGGRWSSAQLRTALSIGIIAEHDKAEAQVPPMKLTDAEIDAFLAYLGSIATSEDPAPTAP